MKIVRYLTSSGSSHGVLQIDGSVKPIEGDLFGEFRVAEKAVQPGKFLVPLVPTNILGIGLNYRKHAEETGKPLPERPLLFIKSTNTVQNPGDPILLPTTQASHKVDFEGELAVIIGKACKNVTRANALAYVFGYTTANDVSARDWQFEWGSGQFCQGKSFDTFCPLGPVLVTRDEVPNPQALKLKTTLNGNVMQESSTNDMVFDVATLIEFLSGSKTLLPGTVILTGTPQGVGAARKPPVWLKPGDSVTVEIESIGSLTNPVSAEK